MTIAFDSWVVVAWLKGEEPAMSALNDVIDQRPAPVISWVNLVEVHYRWMRDFGATRARQVTAALDDELRAEFPGRTTMLAAAELKAANPIALGDCFAIATAAAFDAELWTGDPEILQRASSLPCRVRDLS